MGVTQVEPRDEQRFEEGSDSDFQDVEETATKETQTGAKTESEAHGPGEIHGGIGSATLRECIEKARQQGTVAPAALHSGEGTERSTDPPQVTSQNVEENQPHESTSVKQPSPDEESHQSVKVERKEEDVTPKSEAAQVGVKEEPTEPDSEESAGPEEQEELRRMLDAFPFAAMICTIFRFYTTTTRSK